MENRSLINSFKFACQGFLFAVKHQRNLRIHILIGAGVLLAGFVLKFSPLEMAVLTLTIIFVIICEVINTALELSLDFVNGKRYHPSVKLVKDIVAAGVLLASIAAVIIGSLIFFKHIV